MLSRAILQCLQEVPKRSAAIASANLEKGQATWLAYQRWQWRHGRLGPERSRLLRLLGVAFAMATADQWRDLAHEAAYFMHGCRIGQVCPAGDINSACMGLMAARCL